MQKRRPSRDAVFVISLTGLDCYGSAIRMSILILAALALHVIPLTGSDLFASDIETCKHVSASLGSFVIPATERESPFQWIKHLRHFSLK